MTYDALFVGRLVSYFANAQHGVTTEAPKDPTQAVNALVLETHSRWAALCVEQLVCITNASYLSRATQTLRWRDP